ncbi:MAG TPA: shikimate dehydrogenase [bacterium]
MTIAGTTRVVGLFGYPVAHSFSPLMHNRAFAEAGLDYVYVPFPVPPARLGAAVAALPALGLAGVNVTIPHKQAVLAHLDDLSRTAELIGAVNTIEVTDGKRLIGHNTDAPGFAAALGRHGMVLAGQRVLLLGAGGAARAVAFQAALDGCDEIVLCDVEPARAAALAEEIARHFTAPRVCAIPLVADVLGQALTAATLLVNATPLGMHAGDDYPVDFAGLHERLFVFDLVYNPLETPLLAAARRRAIRHCNGLAMLALQGAESFAIWTGAAPPGELMLTTLEAHFGAR